MKRREMLSLLPLSISGLTDITKVFAGEMSYKNESGLKSKPLAIQYTHKIADMLRWIRQTQSENILEASHAVARTIKNGGTCWCVWDMGHSASGVETFPGRNGDPGVFTYWYEKNKSKKGDLILVNLGEYPPFDDIVKKEILVIGGPAPWGGDAPGREYLRETVQKMVVRPYSHIWIENNVTVYGGIMHLPGMPAPLAPVSGALGMVTYWMILADACRILAQDGIVFDVQGDEPELSGDNIPWVELNDPFMDNYLDEILYQIEMIEAEMGTIREIAQMAVDSVLAGGKVFCYGKKNGFASEASYRRSGLCLTRGLSDSNGKIAFNFSTDTFNDSVNDCVIMGLSKPDDEIDLQHLETFRKYKMKVASIGPMLRENIIPQGKTVPKETDVHLGRMCDTYGLFAVPGYKKKICPTSGALLNIMFWATCCEIAERIIRRTGNTPGVLFSSALIKGRPHNQRMYELYNERGY